MDLGRYKYIVVGSGFFGATVAERVANDLDQKVLVVEKRDHIGGNSYSYIDAQTGIEIHLYGSHIFHTSDSEVWDYINRFSAFNNYRHKVLTRHDGKVYQMPVNLLTINSFYGIDLKPFEVEDFLKSEINKEDIDKPANFEEMAITLAGRPLYEAFIKGYTAKQWQTDPRQLPASIITRLPFRNNYCADYFDDPFQGIPLEGYGKIFGKMLDHQNIKLQLDTDFFEIRNAIANNATIIYTGPIDRFFEYKYGRLSWRTLTFEKEVHNVKDYQGTSVMNFAQENAPYTRIHEFKHFHPERVHSDMTLIFKEYSKATNQSEEPYYPVNTKEDKHILAQYQQEIAKQKNVIFGGRLGTYCYLNMDQVIAKALNVYEKEIKC